MIENEKEIYKNAINDLKEIRRTIVMDPTKRYIQYLLKYAVVLAASSLEQLFKLLMYRLLTINSNPLVMYYLKKTFLEKSYNVSYNNIIKLIKNIDNKNLFEQLKLLIKLMKYEKDIQALDTLVNTRHLVVHENANISISINEIITNFRSGIKILLLIESIIIKILSYSEIKMN